MKNKAIALSKKIKAYVLRHKIRSSVGGLVLVLIIFGIFHQKPANLVTAKAVIQDLESTILATGKVTSITDLALSFNASDVVNTIQVRVGDKVKKGQVLATLNNRDELASLTTARGSLALAEANYEKILEGATSEEIAIKEVALSSAQISLENTKTTQDTLVANAYRALLNSTLEATSTSNSTSTNVAPTISGTYIGTTEGDISINTYSSGSGGYFSASGIVSATGITSTNTNVPLGTSGLFISFPSGFNPGAGIIWTITIPNTKALDYVTNLNAYNSALETRDSALATAQSLIDQKQAELNLEKAEARPAELDAANAEILSAEGKYESASANYENTIIRAPAEGTITVVDIKIGELATAQKPVITLQDITNLYLEANINESNIANIKLNQPVKVTFDSLPKDQIYNAIISSIDPGATIEDGIVNYKINATLTDLVDIKPGMTANMTIIVFSKPNALVIPQKAIIKKDGKTFIQKPINKKKGQTQEVSVTTGEIGDGNLVEITAGLSGGEEVVIQESTK